MFCHTKEDMVSPSSSLLYGLPLSPEIDRKDVLNYDDPPDSGWISYEDPEQRYVKVKFAAPMPPTVPEVKTYASNKSSMSDYCKFAQVVLSLPPMERVDWDFDHGIKYNDSGPSDRAHYQFILHADGML